MRFGTGSRTSIEGGKESKFKPGPGAYAGDASKVQRASPKFGFGSSTRDKLRTLDVPGPGNYAPRLFTGRDGPTYSMGALSTYEPKEKEEKLKPGPGNYNPDSGSSTKKEPFCKFGTE